MIPVHDLLIFLLLIILDTCNSFEGFANVFWQWKHGKFRELQAQVLSETNFSRFFPFDKWNRQFDPFIRYASIYLQNKDAIFYKCVHELLLKKVDTIEENFLRLEILAIEGHQLYGFTKNIFTIMYAIPGYDEAIQELGDLIKNGQYETYIREWLNLLKNWNTSLHGGDNLNYRNIPVICDKGLNMKEGHFFPYGWPKRFQDIGEFCCNKCKVHLLLYDLCQPIR